MSDLMPLQMLAIGLIFVWSGLVRSGIGFGGAAVAMPLLLLIVDNPLIVMPVIAVQLLLFAGITTATRRASVDWAFIGRSFIVMLPFKIIGLIGLLNLPGSILSVVVFVVTGAYGASYLLGVSFRSNSVWLDRALLALGGYASGTSLIGAPLLVAVYVRHVASERLRDTLFVLWILLASMKLAAFLATGVDMQWQAQLWLLPCGAVGHVLGLKVHRRLLTAQGGFFMRVVGAALLGVSLAGLARVIF
ncbi:MAG: TSUP family transporter [Arenicellales bacterium]